MDVIRQNLQDHLLYLAFSGLLTLMLGFTLIQARRVLTRVRVPVVLSAAALLMLARVMLPAFDAVALSWAAAVSGFAFLSSVALMRCATWCGANTEQAADATPKEWPAAGLKRLVIYMGISAAVGLLTFLVTLPDGSVSQLANGLVYAAAVGACIPVLVSLFRSARRADGRRPGLWFASALLAGVVWLTLAFRPVFPAAGADLSRLDRIGDVLSMALMLGALITWLIRSSMTHQRHANDCEVERDDAKSELNKLSAIASNMYEDSSDLIRKQKEQTLQFMRKVESLERILKMGIAIQRHRKLDDVLQMVVKLISDNAGFKTVTLRLYNPVAKTFETSAHVGISDEFRDTVVNYRIPLAEYQKMLSPRFQIGRSYFIRNNNPWYGDELQSDGSELVEDTWGDIDMLIVPLTGEDHEPVGYLSVENPEDPKMSVADVIEGLESVAALAAIAIRNARFMRELERKNDKLGMYAQKLSGLNKLKSNFVATISHEFRTPLTSIKAYCSTLLDNVDNVDRTLLKQFLVVIDEESSRLMTLIDDILDFSHMESGAVRFERSSCDMKQIGAAVADELRKNYSAKNITLHQDMADSPEPFQADPELLKQLLVNIMHNAAKFTSDGGNVWLRIADENTSVRITVEDDGIGVPDDQLAKIFEEFHQADGTSTRKHGGTGLGLAICKNIVEWHNGRIWVENVKNRGARFVIVIPKRQVLVRNNAFGVHNTVRRFEVERVLELVMENVADFMRVRKVSLMMRNDLKDELRIVSAIGVEEDVMENSVVKLGDGIAGKVAESGQTMLVRNIEEDERLNRSNNESIYASKSFLSVPVKRDGAVVGVLNVASPTRGDLTEQDAQLLETLVDRIAVVLERMEEFVTAATGYEKLRETLLSILEARRYIDFNNDGVVETLVIRTAKKLGLADKQISELRFVLYVYDLGLSKVGYHIIKKPHDLSPDDRREIKEHTNLGSEMLSVLDPPLTVDGIVRAHHENFDGSGYPGQLAGEAIPIEARIIRVADTLRALTSQRPYQRQYTMDEALEVIKHRSGSFFDPKVVDAISEVYQDYSGMAELDAGAEKKKEEPDEGSRTGKGNLEVTADE